MTRFYFFLFLICFRNLSLAQNVLPNPGFENWTQVGNRFDPDNWNTLNPNTSIVGVLTCLKATGADVHSGSAALKLITKSVLGQNANGLATTGNIVISPPGVNGGVAYTGRPDSIAGWFKYTSVSGDNGFVEFQLLGSSSTPDTIGYVRFLTPASSVSNYTRFSAPIVYRSSSPVAKSIWIISSSAGFTAQINSTMFLDDLELITNPNGIKEYNLNAIQIYPNPSNGNLSIVSVPLHSRFNVYSTLGNLVLSESINAENTSINLENSESGIYYYEIIQSEKGKIQSGKIFINKE